MEAISFLAGVVVGGLGMWCVLASKSLARRPRSYPWPNKGGVNSLPLNQRPPPPPPHPKKLLPGEAYLVDLGQGHYAVRFATALTPEQEGLKAKKFP